MVTIHSNHNHNLNPHNDLLVLEFKWYKPYSRVDQVWGFVNVEREKFTALESRLLA